MSTEARLPGSELVEPGLRDLAAGIRSEAALLVSLAAPRLRRAGVVIAAGLGESGASLELYDRLSARLGNGAHARHHAMLRRVTSYADAYARAHQR